LTCSWQSFLPQFTTRRLRWDHRTGFRLFGSRYCWWRTTSRSFFFWDAATF